MHLALNLGNIYIFILPLALVKVNSYVSNVSTKLIVLATKKHIVVLTGAGISAESGVKTFRDHNGLWEGHDVMKVASPQGFKNDPNLVLEFYNQRRRQLNTVAPNQAHQNLKALERDFKVTIITQNVDDLHERAGSKTVLHLHGELLKVRSISNPNITYPWTDDLNLGDTDDQGNQLRPHIVWFGEDVPLIQKAAEICQTADIMVIVGTSLQVYPASGLIQHTKQNIPMYYIDPQPAAIQNSNLKIISKKATVGTSDLRTILKQSL